MSYIKTTWQTGDTVTAEKLNHAENGIENANQNALPSVSSTDNGDVLTVVEGAWAKAAPSGGGGVFVVHTTFDDSEYSYTTDKTWTEIFTALSSGTPGLLLMSEDPTNMIISVPIIYVQKNTNEFYVDVLNAVNTDGINLRFAAESADGYCVWIDE